MQTETPDPENLLTDPDAFVTGLQGESWQDSELAAWNPPRQIAAQSMGMLYPFIGEDGLEALARTGVYPGAQRDVIIFLWLRLQTPSAVLRAQRKPGEAWTLAEGWAEKAGLIDLVGEPFKDAYELFSQKMAAIRDSSGTVANHKGKATPEGNA